MIDSLCSGGAQRQMTTLANLFHSKGYLVELLCYHDNRFFEKELPTIKIHWLISPNPISRIIKVRRHIRSNDYNVVISFLKVPNLLNCLSGLGGKSWKVITSERSAHFNNPLSFRERCFGFFQRYSDAIVCNSKNAKELWLRHFPLYRDKLHVIYNSLSLNFALPPYFPKRDGVLHIVVAATYSSVKNPLNAAKALNMLSPEERSRIRIEWFGRIEVVAGDRIVYDEVKDYIVANQLEECFILNPETNSILEKMGSADAVALFSKYEGLPNAIVEGMFLKKPVIMSRVSDYDTFVSDKNGYLCEWNQPNSIRTAFSNMINKTEEELRQMGDESFRIAQNLFSPETIILQWEKLFGE